jgi:hypothetical protein
MLKIYFADFWPGFNPHHNLLKDLLEQGLKEQVYVCQPSEAQQCQLLISSIFGSCKKSFNHIPRVAYIGENIRPDYLDYDLSLSFDSAQYGGRNLRLPLWLWSFDWFGTNPKAHSMKAYEHLLKGCKPHGFRSRAKRCVALIGNGTVDRIHDLRTVSQHLPVDGFGPFWGKPVSGGHHGKLKLLANYQFHFCRENSIYSGYVTEKIIDAKLAGTIPIYHSENNFNDEINMKSFLDLRRFSTESIQAELCNDEYLSELVSQPLFEKLFPVAMISEKFANLCLHHLSTNSPLIF